MAAVKQVAIAIDQLANTLLWFLPGGCWADETFSARCWRCRNIAPFKWLRPVVDAILFFDPQHCQSHFHLLHKFVPIFSRRYKRRSAAPCRRWSELLRNSG